MSFSKRYPKAVDGSAYPKWIEVALTDAEEKAIEQKAREENIRLLKESIEDAEKIVAERNLKNYQTDIITLAIALFDKRASHSIYHKEEKSKEKFDSSN